MFALKEQYVYLYGVLTLLGIGSYEHVFLLDNCCLLRWEKIGGALTVINFSIRKPAKIILMLEDNLFLARCRFYWNGLPLTRKEKDGIFLICKNGIYTLGEIIK